MNELPKKKKQHRKFHFKGKKVIFKWTHRLPQMFSAMLRILKINGGKKARKG